MKKREKIRFGWPMVAAISVGCVCLLIIQGCSQSDAGNSNASDSTRDRYFDVAAGDFPISVLARGQLDAIENYNLRFEGKGRFGLYIEQVVEDKKALKAGEPVISFSSEAYDEHLTELKERLHDLRVDYEENIEIEKNFYEFQLEKLEEELDDARLNIELFLDNQSIDRDNTLSKLTQASNDYEVSKDVLNKYENLDYRTLAKGKQADMDAKEEAYYEAISQLEVANQALNEARLKDDQTREKAERAVSINSKKVTTAFANWENARKAYRQFRRYEHPQKLRRLVIDTEKKELDLKRALVKAESDKVQNQRKYRKLLRDKAAVVEKIDELNEEHPEELEKLETEYATQSERLMNRIEEIESDIDGLILRAPIDGLVTLGNPKHKTPRELIVGSKVAPKEVVARIPDLSQFLVRCDIPEIYRSRISVGQTALLKNAALPDLDMRGTIQSIAAMSAPSIEWNNRSPRVYKTIISTASSAPSLVPGMTVEIEILVETVEDTLFVPVEAVYSRDGSSYCMLKNDFSTEEVEVETGRASNSFVEITAGLEPGDRVFLHTSDPGGGAS